MLRYQERFVMGNGHSNEKVILNKSAQTIFLC